MLDVAIPMLTKLKWFGDSGSMVQFYQVGNKICVKLHRTRSHAP